MDPNKRPDDMVRITTPELAQAFIDEQVAAVREQIGDKKVLLALSGGVDSSVVAALLIKAIGKQLICVHVNHGLMRKGESEQVIDVFKNQLDANLVYVDATDRFLGKLVDVEEPEAKRKIIGAEFIRVFEEEACKVGNEVSFLAQGTIYPDILESQDGVKAHILCIRPFLIRLSKDESAKITLVLSKNAFARFTASSKPTPSRASLSISRTQRTSSGPVDRESRTAIFLSGSASSAKSRAVSALFMLPDSCDEMVMANV